jgi:Zn-finger nucleic acid-binding protein
MKPSEILKCPSCSAKLQGGENKDGPLWLCSVCFGAGRRTEVLREKAPAHVVKALWKTVKEQSGPSERNCLLCRERMLLVSQPLPSGQVLHLDACRRCSLVWFDANEVNDLLAHGPLADGKRKDFMPLLRRDLQKDAGKAVEISPAGHVAIDIISNVLYVVFSALP